MNRFPPQLFICDQSAKMDTKYEQCLCAGGVGVCACVRIAHAMCGGSVTVGSPTATPTQQLKITPARARKESTHKGRERKEKGGKKKPQAACETALSREW